MSNTSSDEKVEANMSKDIARKRQKLPSKLSPTKRNTIIGTATNRSRKTKLANVTSKHSGKVAARRSVRGFPTIHKINKTKRSINAPLKETNNLVGKFVLPSRSVHSSRVIKPNKRFINVEESRTFKKRVINKRQSVKETAKGEILNKSESESETQESTDVHETAETRISCTNGKVVLRQARLQLQNQNPTGPEGPFSSGNSNISSPPGTVTCGVCGAVRFYRFVKQARKFNIYSCESCRKFISKMIKRQSNKNSNAPTLVCHKGQGMCHVPPIVRSQQWKLIRCAYKARCPACWLKMCLRSFQMPAALKNSLALLLPKNMQTHDTLFSSSLPLLSWQSSAENKSDKPENLEGEQEQSNNDPKDQACRQRPVRLKAVKKEEKLPLAPNVSEIKRQKLDLKGPRVKHVCRSASIVLGQPFATFPSDNKKGEPEQKDTNKNVEAFSETNIYKSPLDCNIDATPEDKENSIELVAEIKPAKPHIQKVETATNISVSKREKFTKHVPSQLHSSEVKSFLDLFV